MYGIRVKQLNVWVVKIQVSFFCCGFVLCIGVGWLVVREKKCGCIDLFVYILQGFLGLNSDMFLCYYEREIYGGIYYINKCFRGKWEKNNILKCD